MIERTERVAALLMELTADFIMREANTDPLITVTRVDLSPDLKNATVYFTTIPDEREQDARIFLQRLGGELRQHVKKSAALKTIPFFTFAIDHGERHRQHMDEVVRELEEEGDNNK